MKSPKVYKNYKYEKPQKNNLFTFWETRINNLISWSEIGNCLKFFFKNSCKIRFRAASSHFLVLINFLIYNRMANCACNTIE